MDLGDTNDGKNNQYGVLKLQPQSPLDSAQNANHFSFSNPVYEPSASGGPTYKVEDVVVRMSGDVPPYRKTSSAKPWCAIQKGLKARWEVAQSIWHYMLAISLVYMVTLSLYPGIVTEIVSCKFGTWMPVILMASFNLADLIGKVIAPNFYDWPRDHLIIFGIGRIAIIPAILLCAMPRDKPISTGENLPLFWSFVLGISNGVIGSVPMIQAPSKVPEQHREITGNIMTLSYNFGLTAGSLLAYVFKAMLGASLTNPCDIAGFTGSAITNLSIYNLTTISTSTETSLTTLTTMTSTAAITTIANNFSTISYSFDQTSGF